MDKARIFEDEMKSLTRQLVRALDEQGSPQHHDVCRKGLRCLNKLRYAIRKEKEIHAKIALSGIGTLDNVDLYKAGKIEKFEGLEKTELGHVHDILIELVEIFRSYQDSDDSEAVYFLSQSSLECLWKALDAYKGMWKQEPGDYRLDPYTTYLT